MGFRWNFILHDIKEIIILIIFLKVTISAMLKKHILLLYFCQGVFLSNYE